MVITISSLKDYDYGEMVDFANDLGRKCKIGYRGKNTGVILLMTQNPKRYRIHPTHDVSGYITVVDIKSILSNSKKVCEKQDMSCRALFISQEIEKEIAQEVNRGDENEVGEEKGKERYVEATRQYDAEESEKKKQTIGNWFFALLGGGGVLGGIIGGGIWGYKKIARKKRKNQFIEGIKVLKNSFEEKEKHYKDKQWVIDTFIVPLEKKIEEIEKKYSEKETKKSHSETMQSLDTIKTNLNTIDWEIQKMKESLQILEMQCGEKMRNMKNIATKLNNTGFEFPTLGMKTNYQGDTKNVADRKSFYENLSVQLSKYISLLNTIESNHSELQRYEQNLPARIQQESQNPTYKASIKAFQKKLGQNYKIQGESVNDTSVGNILQAIHDTHLKKLQQALTDKSVDQAQAEKKEIENVFSQVMEFIETVNNLIERYNNIVEYEFGLEGRLSAIQDNSEYYTVQKKLKTYGEGEEYSNFSIPETKKHIKNMRKHMKDEINNKNISDAEGYKEEIEADFKKIQGFIGLSIILDQEIQRVAEEERRRREREEQEERERRREEARKKEERENDDEDDSYGSGGGGGWGGAGGEDD